MASSSSVRLASMFPMSLSTSTGSVLLPSSFSGWEWGVVGLMSARGGREERAMPARP